MNIFAEKETPHLALIYTPLGPLYAIAWVQHRRVKEGKSAAALWHRRAKDHYSRAVIKGIDGTCWSSVEERWGADPIFRASMQELKLTRDDMVQMTIDGNPNKNWWKPISKHTRSLTAPQNVLVSTNKRGGHQT